MPSSVVPVHVDELTITAHGGVVAPTYRADIIAYVTGDARTVDPTPLFGWRMMEVPFFGNIEVRVEKVRLVPGSRWQLSAHASFTWPPPPRNTPAVT